MPAIIRPIGLRPKPSKGALSATDILEGETNYPAVMAALRRAGYDDWVTAEIFPGAGRDHKEFLMKNSKAMDKIINEM